MVAWQGAAAREVAERAAVRVAAEVVRVVRVRGWVE